MGVRAPALSVPCAGVLFALACHLRLSVLKGLLHDCWNPGCGGNDGREVDRTWEDCEKGLGGVDGIPFVGELVWWCELRWKTIRVPTLMDLMTRVLLVLLPNVRCR